MVMLLSSPFAAKLSIRSGLHSCLCHTITCMHQERLIGVLLRPSLFSSTVSMVISLAVLGAANWTYVSHKLLFYDYFFGPDGMVRAIQESSDSSAILDVVFSKSFGYNLAILGGAIAAGFAVFILLQVLSRVTKDASGVYEDLRAIDSVPKRMIEREIGRRIIMRIVLAVVWIAYTFVTIKLIMPFCVFTTGVGLKALWGLDGIAFILFGLAMSFACLHLHVVLARLFLFRPRVFGTVIE